MNSKEQLLDIKKTNSKEHNSPDTLNHKKTLESPKVVSKPKNVQSSKEINQLFLEIETKTDFSLSFREIYNIHMKEIEEKTNLKRQYIYYFILVSFFFFLIGHFELIFSYILTGYFPIKWTYEDFKNKREHSGKKWGTYWGIFSLFIYLDFHKKIVLNIMPFYFFVKSIILLILYLPCFTVAINLYDGIIKELILQISLLFQNKDEDTLLSDAKKYIKFKEE